MQTTCLHLNNTTKPSRFRVAQSKTRKRLKIKLTRFRWLNRGEYCAGDSRNRLSQLIQTSIINSQYSAFRVLVDKNEFWSNHYVVCTPFFRNGWMGTSRYHRILTFDMKIDLVTQSIENEKYFIFVHLLVALDISAIKPKQKKIATSFMKARRWEEFYGRFVNAIDVSNQSNATPHCVHCAYGSVTT